MTDDELATLEARAFVNGPWVRLTSAELGALIAEVRRLRADYARMAGQEQFMVDTGRDIIAARDAEILRLRAAVAEMEPYFVVGKIRNGEFTRRKP